MARAKKISQSQIAQELGVSQSLVSIVLNGRREGIAESTYKRIWEYALAYGYSPKGMKLPDGVGESQTKTVGYLLRAPLRLANKSNFFSHVTQGLHDYLREHEAELLFIGSELDFRADDFHKVSRQLKRLQGIVVMGQVAPAFLSALRKESLPVVYVSARSPGYCHSVVSNEYQAAEQLVEHLYDLGHRRFAYLGGMCARSRNEERLQALEMALQRYGLTLSFCSAKEHNEAERKEGYEVAEQILHSAGESLPTAWVCVNALMARGAMSRLFQAGLRVPEDVSVCAYDNTRVSSDELPGITSAFAKPEDLGREAGRIVLEDHSKTSDSLADLVLPSRFYARESTGPVSGG